MFFYFLITSIFYFIDKKKKYGCRYFFLIQRALRIKYTRPGQKITQHVQLVTCSWRFRQLHTFGFLTYRSIVSVQISMCDLWTTFDYQSELEEDFHAQKCSMEFWLRRAMVARKKSQKGTRIVVRQLIYNYKVPTEHASYTTFQ